MNFSLEQAAVQKAPVFLLWIRDIPPAVGTQLLKSLCSLLICVEVAPRQTLPVYLQP